MADRTVSVKLTADISDYTSKLAAAAAATKSLPDQVDRNVRPGMASAGQRAGVAFADGLDQGVRRADNDVRRSGEKSGGILAQGMSQGLMRNSPLIVAAVGGALAVGAPAAIAGATTLFAGIGIVAAAQSESVQHTWRATWDDIKAGAIEDSASLVPILEGIADRVGAAFEDMRPLLADAFEAVGPQIDILADSVLGMAQNALPGLVRAIQNGTPVIEGLGSFLEDVGTATGEFFEILSRHSPAAGAAFAALGDIMGELMPILGELLGQGAELAADVLPMLADTLGTVRRVIEAIGPALPAIVAGFAGMKLAGSGFGALGAGLQGIAGTDSSLGRLGGTLKGLGAALPIVGAGVGLLVGALGESERNIEKNTALFATWHQNLALGGAAAEKAAAQFRMLEGFEDKPESAPWFMRNDIENGNLDEALDAAAAAAREYWEALTPLEQAQAKVSEWSETLAHRLDTLGPKHDDTRIAAQKLAEWEQAAAEAAEQMAQESTGLSTTLEQAQEAAEGLSGALDVLNGGQLNFNEASREWQENLGDARDQLQAIEDGVEGATTSLDISTVAGRANAEMFDDMAIAAMDMANATYEQTGSYDQFRDTLNLSRLSLYDMRRQYGETEEQAWAYVDSVLAIPPEVATDATLNSTQVKSEVDRVLGMLEGVPPGVEVNVGILDEQASLQLHQLGYELRTLPTGEVIVTATDTATPVVDGVKKKVDEYGKSKAWASLDAQDMASSIIEMLNLKLDDFGNKKSKPAVDVDPAPFWGKLLPALEGLGNFGKQKPTPVADLNSQSFGIKVAGAMATTAVLGAQKPTPVADLDDNKSFKMSAGRVASALGTIAAQRPTPIVLADTKQAHVALDSVQDHINRLQGRTITVTLKSSLPAGFASGGYTGHGGVHEAAGIVHKGEFVVPQKRVRDLGGPGAVAARVGVPMGGLRGYAAGGFVHDPRVPINYNIDSGDLNAGAKRIRDSALSAIPGGGGAIAGGGAMWQRLFATIKAAFPRANHNSGPRSSNDLHGAGRAVDLGEQGFAGGAGRPYLAAMAKWIYTNHGSRTAELIYTGAYDSTPDLKNGKPLNYGAATNAAHRNHVHWAMANGGVIGEPVAGFGMWSGDSYSFGERGPEVVTPTGREWSGAGAMSGASGGSSRSVNYGDIHVTANPDRESIARVVQQVLHEREVLASPWTR